MSNVFNIKRFWQYFCFELRRVVDRYGISLIILSTLPITIYIISGFSKLIFGGTHIWSVDSKTTAITAMVVAIIQLILSFPVKMYGDLTDRKSGGIWTMLPVSSLEKLASMLVVSIIIVPAVIFFGNIFVNEVISWIDASYTNVFTKLFQPSLLDADSGLLINVCPLFLIWLETAEWIIFFVLGSIVFKRGKVGKTFLVVLLNISILCLLIFLCFGTIDENSLVMFGHIDENNILLWLNIFVNACVFLYFATMDVLLFFRIKKIKY